MKDHPQNLLWAMHLLDDTGCNVPKALTMASPDTRLHLQPNPNDIVCRMCHYSRVTTLRQELWLGTMWWGKNRKGDILSSYSASGLVSSCISYVPFRLLNESLWRPICCGHNLAKFFFSSGMATRRTETLWHRRLATQAIRSASTEEALRTGNVNLEIPKITPLVLDTPAPRYSDAVQPANLDIQPPTSPPPEFDSLEPGPRHRDYTPYVPAGLELESYEPGQLVFEESDLLVSDENHRNNQEMLGDVRRITTIELAPSPNCNFGFYGLLPPQLDPGPSAPISGALRYPQCRSLDCTADAVRTHSQGPYQDGYIPKELHGILVCSLEVHGLKDIFQGSSIPPAGIWDALYRIISGTAVMDNDLDESRGRDWEMVENFRAWHCFGHRSVEEYWDSPTTDTDSESNASDGEGGSICQTDETDDEEDSGPEASRRDVEWVADLMLLKLHGLILNVSVRQTQFTAAWRWQCCSISKSHAPEGRSVSR